jgi:hypothetical protein
MSLYTPEVREYIFSRNWPRGVIVDIYENDEPAPHLNIIFYRDNWLTLQTEDHLRITEIVKEIMAKLWADGIPTYTGKMEASNGGSGVAT